MANLRIQLWFLVFYANLYIATLCHGFCLPEEHIALFIFGDSMLDVGNNNYINTTTDMQANFWPYGETSFKYPSGRPSNGRLISDFIGAGALVETNQGLVIDLKTQLKYFIEVERLLKQKLGHAEAERLLSRAIYLFSIGSNDYFVPFISNSTMLQMYHLEVYVDMVIGNLTSVIKEIYEKGGRKFGFLNLPPLGCLPGMRALMPRTKDGCVEEAMELAQLHNGALREVLQKLETKLKGFKYSYIDFYTCISERMKNPSKYGFKEGNIACCGGGFYRGFQSCGGQRTVKEYELCDNVKEYLIFDAAHPTEKANQQIAVLMWNGDHKVAGPYNLRELYES